MSLVYYLVNKLDVAPSDYDDMVSIGTIGLIKAVVTFDESKNVKFATYASKIINNEIYRHYRKEKPHAKDVSLDNPIADDGKGNELTLGDITPSSATPFTVQIEQREMFEKLINIVLNCLESRERYIMLCEISGCKQNQIAQSVNISQAQVSRIQSKSKKKIREYMTNLQEYRQHKKVFSMSIVGDFYRISFSSQDVKQFNKIFARLMQNLESAENLPDFKVDCNKERIIIQVPAYLEAFSFVAQIIQEIDEFSMTYVADKDSIAEADNVSRKSKTLKTTDEKREMQKTGVGTTMEVMAPETTTEEDVVVSEAVEEPVVEIGEAANETTIFKGRRKSKLEPIREYILSRDSISFCELRQRFPNVSITTINNALNSLKKKQVITSTCRGEYQVHNEMKEN